MRNPAVDAQLAEAAAHQQAGRTAGVLEACRWAGDLPRLSELRRRMRESPLCDAKGFARDIEAAYRHMWQSWCGRQSAAGSGVR
jgi:hypothetical protein